MASKSVDWMKSTLAAKLDQFDQFTTKLAAYTVTFGLTPGEITASRNDYLWARYAQMQVDQFDAELTSRVNYRDALFNGPATATASPVPSVGSEFAQPGVAAVPDGVLGRWRKLVERIKAHPNYTPSIGVDLGIVSTAAPDQATKPKVTGKPKPGGAVALRVVMDGHDSVIIFCRRGSEVLPSKLGSYTSAKIEDSRANLAAGVPEVRDYTAQYQDKDVAVGDVSDSVRVTTLP